MIEWILRFALILTAVILINVLYSTFLYRQKNKIWKIGIIATLSFLVILGSFIGWYKVQLLYSIPYGGNILKIIDSPFSAFFNYVPQWFIWVWFVLPIAIAWIFFIGKSGFVYEKIKKEYFEFIKKQREKDAKDGKKAEKEVEKKNNIQQSLQDKTLSTSNNEISDTPSKELVSLKKIAPKSSSKTQKMPPQQYFLGEEYPTTRFNYASLQGITKAIRFSKKHLILGKTRQGYVAVYATKGGYQKLKKIFSENSLDIAPLKGSPSVVFFTYKKIKAYTIRDYVSHLEAREVRKTNAK